MYNGNIYLMGFMGCGKTSVGKKIAKLSNLNFIDLDIYIENLMNKKIPEIFESKGEDFFRKIEHNALIDVLKVKNTVTSVGGGTPVYFNNIELINNNSLSIYLKLNSKALFNRINNSKTKRPLISSMSTEKLLEYIDKKLSEREKYYNQAKIVINGLSINANTLLSQIVNFE